MFNIDFSYQTFLQFFIALFYVAQIFINKASAYAIKRYGALAFANLASFGTILEYRLLSGGFSREVAYTVLFFTIIFESLAILKNFMFDRQKTKKVFLIATVLISVSCFMQMFYEAGFLKSVGGNYMAELGGNLTNHYEDLQETKKFLGDEKFFATYASAQEVVSGQFQPSGVDYIIHVLGDEQRKIYLENFMRGDFKYAATIKKEFTLWEYWVERANWFFYRQLYKNYTPVFENSYEKYWKKIDGKKNVLQAENANLRYEIIDVSPQIKKIKFYTDVSVNGFADFYIDYEVCRSKSKRNLFPLSGLIPRPLGRENSIMLEI